MAAQTYIQESSSRLLRKLKVTLIMAMIMVNNVKENRTAKPALLRELIWAFQRILIGTAITDRINIILLQRQTCEPDLLKASVITSQAACKRKVR